MFLGYFSLCGVDKVLLLTQFKFNFIGGTEFSGKVLELKEKQRGIHLHFLAPKKLSTQP